MDDTFGVRKTVSNPEAISGDKKVCKNVLYVIEDGNFSIKDSNIHFINCTFKSANGEHKIDIKAANAVFEHCNFFIQLDIGYSSCTFVGCTFKQIDSTALIAENDTTLHVENCVFCENGTKDVLAAQITVFKSAFHAKNITVKDGINAFGLEAANSSFYLDGALILSNEGCGISLKFCKFEIAKSTIEQNGSSENDFTQIIIDNSKGTISNTKIKDGLNSNGIVATDKSDVEVVNSEICSHTKNGIAVERSSKMSLKHCQIEKNGDEYEETLQLWVDDSKLYLLDCLIQNGVCGIYAQKNSYITVHTTRIKNNLGAVCVFESSKLDMRDCSIEMTVEKIPVWIEESYAVLKNITLENNENQKIVYMDSMMYVDVKNMKIDKNCKDSVTVKNSKNVHTDLKCLDGS